MAHALPRKSMSTADRIGRREFIVLLGGAAAAWPVAAWGQQTATKRVGVLMSTAEDDMESKARIAAFVQGLKQLGWTSGHNLLIEYRWSGGSAADTRKDANELVALGPDVILASGGSVVGPLLQATSHGANRVYADT